MTGIQDVQDPTPPPPTHTHTQNDSQPHKTCGYIGSVNTEDVFCALYPTALSYTSIAILLGNYNYNNTNSNTMNTLSSTNLP